MIEDKFKFITKEHLLTAFEQFETQKKDFPDSKWRLDQLRHCSTADIVLK